MIALDLFETIVYLSYLASNSILQYASTEERGLWTLSATPHGVMSVKLTEGAIEVSNNMYPTNDVVALDLCGSSLLTHSNVNLTNGVSYRC